MSSTNRGGQRMPDDDYATPAWATRAILPHLPTLRRAHVVEPFAGEGAIVEVLLAEGVKAKSITAIEIDETRSNVLKTKARQLDTRNADFFKTGAWRYRKEAPLIITNPPYSLATECVKACLAIADGFATTGRGGRKPGMVAMLLRLPYLESKKRSAFHRERPADVYILSRRPSFTPDGKTDSTAYAWFVWNGPKGGGTWEILSDA